MNVKEGARSGGTTYVNTSALRNATIPKTKTTKSNVANARNCFNNLTLPEKCSKKTELANGISNLSQIEKTVDGIIKYIKGNCEI